MRFRPKLARKERQAQLRNAVSELLEAQCSRAAEPEDSAADRPEEAMAPQDLPQSDTCPANLDKRNARARAGPGLHRQIRPGLVPV